MDFTMTSDCNTFVDTLSEGSDFKIKWVETSNLEKSEVTYCKVRLIQND